MIIAATDLQGGHLVHSRDAANESPNAGFKIGLDPINAVLGAEDNVIVQRSVRVCHLWEFSVWEISIVATRRGYLKCRCAGLERPA
jgi:hypothetical protein